MVLVALGFFTDFVLFVVPCTAGQSAASTTASSCPCSASGLVAIHLSPMDVLLVATLGPRPALRPTATCLRGGSMAGPCITTAPSGRGRGIHLGQKGVR